MFQSHVFFKDNSYYTISRKRDRLGKKKVDLMKGLNTSTLFPEGEGVTATSLGQHPSGGGKYIPRSHKVLHRVPSVEGATATSLGTLTLANECKKINRKNAPIELSHCNNQTTRRIDNGA